MEVPLRAAADWPAPVERASAPEERIVPEVGTKEVISGRNPVHEVLRAGRRTVHRIVVARGSAEGPPGRTRVKGRNRDACG